MKDNVNHPSHYETGKFECIEVMLETQGKEAVKDFCICNAFKYIYRHNNKNGVEDIKKAKWYLDKYIEIDEGEECKSPANDRLEYIQRTCPEAIEKYGIEHVVHPDCIFFKATKLKWQPWTIIDTNLSDTDFNRMFAKFLGRCQKESNKDVDWKAYKVKVARAMEENKNQTVVSDEVLEDICNGTIHADNETSDVMEDHTVKIIRLTQMYGRAMCSRNVTVTYHPNFDVYLMTALVSSHNLEHQMVKGYVDYKTLALELLRFFEYLDMSYSDGEEDEDE